MFSLILCWTFFCVQAFLCAQQPVKPTNSASKVVVGDNVEVERLEPIEMEVVELDKLEMDELEVVELDEPVKPVLHGTIVRITSKDKPCNLRMSPNKYPAAASGAGSSRQHVVGCGLGEDGEGRSDLWEIFNEASTKVVLPFFIINVCIPLFRISLTLTFL